MFLVQPPGRFFARIVVLVGSSLGKGAIICSGLRVASERGLKTVSASTSLEYASVPKASTACDALLSTALEWHKSHATRYCLLHLEVTIRCKRIEQCTTHVDELDSHRFPRRQ
jgi:hypothetical protein